MMNISWSHSTFIKDFKGILGGEGLNLWRYQVSIFLAFIHLLKDNNFFI